MMLQTTYLSLKSRVNCSSIHKKVCLFVPRCLPVTQNALVCHMITGIVKGGSVIFPCQFKILNLKFSVKFWSVRKGSPSFLALAHHPNLRLSVSTGFHHRASQRSFIRKTNYVIEHFIFTVFKKLINHFLGAIKTTFVNCYSILFILIENYQEL